MPVLQLVCHPSWMRDEIADSGVNMHHSYGIEIPHFSREDIWWMPQAFAVELNQSLCHYALPSVELIAPSAQLLSSLPIEFTQRKIQTLTVAEAINSPQQGWWKSAEAKIDTFEARYRSAEQLVEDITASSLPLTAILHYTSTTLPIAREFRSFVKDGVVLTTSVYLVNDNDTQTIVYDGAEPLLGDIEKIEKYLNNVLRSIEIPPSVVVDTAILQDESIALLEFNPAWCSAWYNCDIPLVVETIAAGFNLKQESLDRWKYVPDPYLVEKIGKRAILPQSPIRS